jgi:TRAP-type mannitol/chloroaromatic compound transport system substrate-binding protein
MNGSVELGWTFASYYFGKDPVFAFVGGNLPLGIDAAAFVRWMEGTGKAVRSEVFAVYGVKAFPCSIAGPKGLWLRKEVRGLEDMKGLRLRIGGTTGLALQSTGVIPQQIAGGDIYPALEKGTIDGVEWLTPPMDEKLGFYKAAKYYYYTFGEPSFSGISDLIVNKKVWDELEPNARDVIENACHRQLHTDLGKLSEGVTPALQRMTAGGVVVGRLPEAIAASYRQGAVAFLEQAIKSPTGLSAWKSLKAAR